MACLFDLPEHAVGAVVLAAGGLGVEVTAHADGRERRVGAFAQARITALVDALQRSLQRTLGEATWMDAETTRAALAKLETMRRKVMPGVDFDYTLPVNRNFGIVVTGRSSTLFALRCGLPRKCPNASAKPPNIAARFLRAS